MERLRIEAVIAAAEVIDHPRWRGSGQKTRVMFHVARLTLDPELGARERVHLSNRTLSAGLGIDGRRSWDALRGLVADGVLCITEKGVGRRATAYGFADVDEWHVPWAIPLEEVYDRVLDAQLAPQVQDQPAFVSRLMRDTKPNSVALMRRAEARHKGVSGRQNEPDLTLERDANGLSVASEARRIAATQEPVVARLERAASAAPLSMPLALLSNERRATSLEPEIEGGRNRLVEKIQELTGAPIYGSPLARLTAAVALGVDVDALLLELERIPPTGGAFMPYLEVIEQRAARPQLPAQAKPPPAADPLPPEPRPTREEFDRVAAGMRAAREARHGSQPCETAGTSTDGANP